MPSISELVDMTLTEQVKKRKEAGLPTFVQGELFGMSEAVALAASAAHEALKY